MDTPDDPTTETLAGLIRTMKGRRSYPDLALESGPGLGRGRWQQLGDPNFPLSNVPRADTVKSIATVLRVPERRVWLAIGRGMGVDVDAGMSPLIANMVDGTSALSAAQVELTLSAIAELVDLQLTVAGLRAALTEAREEVKAVTEPPVRLRAARTKTGNEARGTRGGTKSRG